MEPTTNSKPKKKPVAPAELAALCAEIADSRKAENIVQLHLSELSSVADYFVICTGNSDPHLKAIADHIVRQVREKTGKRPRSVDGQPSSKWVVIDFASVIVHVLSPDTRELYQLESLWGDAPQLDAVKKLEDKSIIRLLAKPPRPLIMFSVSANIGKHGRYD